MAEGLVDQAFVKEQTDLPLLVRADTGRFLRQTDVNGAGREDQLYVYDSKAGAIAKAPRGTLAFTGDPALDRRLSGHAGTTASKVTRHARSTPRLKAHLDAEYTPEKAQEKSGCHASLIRTLAKKVATKRTCSYIGFSIGQDLPRRPGRTGADLAMGLTGNWGKPGTGWNCWAISRRPRRAADAARKAHRPGRSGAVRRHGAGAGHAAEDRPTRKSPRS